MEEIPFDKLDEAKQFIEWYEQAYAVSNWDTTRYVIAQNLLNSLIKVESE